MHADSLENGLLWLYVRHENPLLGKIIVRCGGWENVFITFKAREQRKYFHQPAHNAKFSPPAESAPEFLILSLLSPFSFDLVFFVFVNSQRNCRPISSNQKAQNLRENPKCFIQN